MSTTHTQKMSRGCSRAYQCESLCEASPSSTEILISTSPSLLRCHFCALVHFYKPTRLSLPLNHIYEHIKIDENSSDPSQSVKSVIFSLWNRPPPVPFFHVIRDQVGIFGQYPNKSFFFCFFSPQGDVFFIGLGSIWESYPVFTI